MDTVVASVDIAAPADILWRVLTEPALMLHWNNGSAVETTWQPGAPILTHAKIGAKTYRDAGRVEIFDPPHRLQYRYHSRVSGLPDRPEHHYVLDMELVPLSGGDVRLTVTHRVPPSPVRRGRNWVIGPESGVKHVQFHWRMTLPVLKSVAEAVRAGVIPAADAASGL